MGERLLSFPLFFHPWNNKMGDKQINAKADLVRELSKTHFDYIFAGFGASASLLLLEMDRRNLLNGANVLILDPGSPENSDKTFCFWAAEEDPIVENLHPLISHSWSEAKTGNQENCSINPYQYYHIPGKLLYKQACEIIQKNKCQHLRIPVNSIHADEGGTFVCVGDHQLSARRIFDSRPPVFRQAERNEIHIHQSFVGLVIETENPVFDEKSIHFMDFNISQNGGTQFVYLLPFSAKTALVELTRFGSDVIREEESIEQIKVYINDRFGQFTVNSVERGCIPMSNAEIINQNLPGISLLGSRNYSVKPSTGYAFKNMHRHAVAIGDCLTNSNEKGLDALNNEHSKTTRGRFAFYDALLLRILKHNPELGKPIFLKLFGSSKLGEILRFLDEKSSLKAECLIFSRLPYKPFIISLIRQLNGSKWVRPLILAMLTVLLLAIGFVSNWQMYAGYTLFFSGMLLVGIPHGAVDHLLESGKWENKNISGFILRYLLQAFSMALVWYLTPNLALILFLAYSIWHFGQADGQLWGLHRHTATLWGASVIIFILGTHTTETNSILSYMSSLKLPIQFHWMAMMPWLLYAIYKQNFSFAITIIWLSLTSFLPLMFAFGLYFIGQHSCTSWVQICRHLNYSHKQVWLQALPFNLAAWVLMAAFFLLWPMNKTVLTINPWGIFFMFISCISLPHAFAMQKIYRNKP